MQRNTRSFWTKRTYINNFYNKISDILQSQRRKARISKGSNKKSFATNLLHFCALKTQQRYILQDEKKTSKKTQFNGWHFDFLTTYDKASEGLQLPLLKSKVDIGTTKSKDKFFAHYWKDMIEHPKRQYFLSLTFQNNHIRIFSFKKYELHANQFSLTEIVKLNHRENQHLFKYGNYVANKCEIIESIYDVYNFHRWMLVLNINIKLIVKIFCLNEMCSGIFCVHKKTFQSLRRSNYHCLQCKSACQVRNIPCEEQTYSFFLKFEQGIFYFLKRHNNEIKMLLESSFVLEGNINDKIVSMFIHGKGMMKFVTNMLNAKRAATFWTLLLRTKNRQLCCSVVMVKFALQKKRVLTTKKKSISIFEDVSRPLTIKHTRTWTKKAKIILFLA